MVKVLKLTDKNSGHQDLKTASFTLSFTLSLSPTEDLLLRGSKIGLRPLGGLLLSLKGSLSSDVLWPLHAEFMNSSMASPTPMALDIVVEAWIEDTSSCAGQLYPQSYKFIEM